ncbi:hypothetical protein HPP92_024378 [Vanilla planifolia]|uniref:Uncharacterized protein n=1 Tax=Vanilla planifolia TaxID=51239 RepID=A0A835PMA0_VANPL|nr:hypothetical protein HPP92_024378 [Vanilla planifolia]
MAVPRDIKMVYKGVNSQEVAHRTLKFAWSFRHEGRCRQELELLLSDRWFDLSARYLQLRNQLSDLGERINVGIHTDI